MSKVDKSRAVRWCKVCDQYRQTYQVEKVTDGGKVYCECCLFCDSVFSKSKKPRKVQEAK